jgi:hypothetical protein
MSVVQQTAPTVKDRWWPIRRIGRPRIDAVASETFNLRVTLATKPSPDWREAFMEFENGVERSTFMITNPCLVGKAVTVSGVREKDVEPWFGLIDAKIDGANVQYAERTSLTVAARLTQQAAGLMRQRDAQGRADQIATRWEGPDS